jgi:hypothetical protein
MIGTHPVSTAGRPRLKAAFSPDGPRTGFVSGELPAFRHPLGAALGTESGMTYDLNHIDSALSWRRE